MGQLIGTGPVFVERFMGVIIIFGLLGAFLGGPIGLIAGILFGGFCMLGAKK